MKLLEKSEKEVAEVLSNSGIDDRKIIVPWSRQPVPVSTFIYRLNDYEILHTGWNPALMDHLNIPRFPALQQMWGE